MARTPAHPNLIAAWIAASIAMLIALAVLAVPASANVMPTVTAPYGNTGAGQSGNYSQNMSFTYNPTGSNGQAGDDLRRLAIDYPAGLVGNPNAITAANRCNTPDYNGGTAGLGVPGDVTAGSGSPDYSSCPASSIVGSISTNVDARAWVIFPIDCNITLNGSIYLLRNRPNANPEVPTYLGIHVSGSAGGLCALGGTSTMDMTARITLRPTDQGLRIIVIDDLPRTAATGVGTAYIRINYINQTINATAPGGQPFLKNPTRCDTWTTVAYAAAWDSNSNLNADVYAPVGNDHISTSSNQTPTCGSLATFNPGFTLTPTTTQAGQPTGMTAVLSNTWAVPQPANVKRVDMTFPVGYEINPAIANKVGSVGCTTAQFNEANPDVAPTCPAATQVGTVNIVTPMITPSVPGQVYLGQPLDAGANRYRLMVYAANGAAVKFEARANVAANGQVTVIFGDSAVVGKSLPQFPWTSFTLAFFGGADAMLTNPQTCGSGTDYQATAQITPWTSPNQGPVMRTQNMTVTAGPNSSGCSFDSFDPGFSASVSDTGASKHPNLTLTATRSDRQDNLRDMTFRLPDGFAGSVNNVVATCADVDAAAGNCTSTSQLGQVVVQTGSGAQTVTLNGTVHLNTALSSELAKVSIQVPAVVGPFDLGDVVMYATMVINSGSTMSINAVTVNMPQRIQGIPVRYRSVALTLNGIATQGTGSTADDKPFLQNPSACSTLNFQATYTSNGDASGAAPPGSSSIATVVKTDTDQSTTNCTQTFNPTVTVTPTTTVAATPTGLGVTITVPQTTVGVTSATVQQSTVKRVQLQMPAGMYINPGFANGLTACATADIDAGGAACAVSSEVGTVSLTSPLLAAAQTGKVYIETPGGTPATRYKLAIVVNLPSGYLVIRGTAQVNGSGGGADSGTGVVTADFNNLPDVPFSNFTMNFNGGANAMLTNPDSCSAKTFPATISPHSGGADAARTPGYTTTGCPATAFVPTFAGSVSTTVAGAHPDVTMTVTRPDFHQPLRNLNLHLPTGLAANTSATTQCSQANATAGNCLVSQRVGTISTTLGSGASTLTVNGFIYNVVPNANEPARLQAIIPVTAGPFDLGSLSIPVTTSLRADWGIDTATQLPLLFEGVPVRIRTLQMVLNGTAGGNSFMTNPSKCQVNTVNADMISPTPTTVAGSFNYTTTGCPQAFNPTVTAAVTTTETAKPTGLTLGINVPANHSSISRVQTTLPVGMTINPAVGNGPLQACSAALIDAGGAGCPATSDQGNITLTTPLLPSPVSGDVYLETPGVTPATRYKLALVIRIPGRNLVVHGSSLVNGSGLGADSGTGQITADFNGLPDLGWTSMSLAFNSGNRALFVNPETCGSKTVSMDLTPSTTGGAVATRTANFTTDYNGSGGACPGTDPFAPGFTVGVSTTVAGAHPDVTLTVTRPDKNQQIRNLNLHLPVGLVANTSATPQCSQANAAIGACVAGNQVGSITTAVGSGAETYSLAGTLYNVVPNAGEPARFYAKIPVVVGPFDLGAINIPVPTSMRADWGIDTTTQLPLMWEGVPVRVRSLQMVLNGTAGGNSFMTNPSKCQVNTVNADVISPTPTTAAVSGSYTTTGCPQTFNPSITATVNPTENAQPTALTLGINVPANHSTVSRVQTTFPVGMEINPGAGNGLLACATATIDAGGAGCPATSDQGNVTLTTPLLTAPVSGDIYLETPGVTPATRYKLAIVLRIPGRNLVIHGSAQVNGSGGGSDSGNGQVTADFDGIPDLGFSNLTLAFNGGGGALFTNPDTCGSKTVSMDLTPNTTGGAVATRTANFTVDGNGSGGACASPVPYTPTFTGSVSTTAAGGHPNLTMTVNRTDKHQQLRDLAFHLPTGMVANTSATPQCAQATAAAGNCVAGQQVGSISTTVGSGATTLALSGQIYNVVPNAGEPARLYASIPVVVGPFDLGKLNIPVATSLRADFGIDATTTVPLRYEGVPVRIRQLQMVLNGTAGGNDFMVNPSKCQSNTVSADMTSPTPTTVSDSFNFTTTGCPVAFNPTISAAVSSTETAKPTGLTIGINVPTNNSTLNRVQLTLPPGMEINPAVGNGPLLACATATIDAGGAGCPATSDMGNVSLTTPLLTSGVSGDIYLETPGVTPATRYKLAIVLRLPGRNLVIHGSAQVSGSGAGADSGTGQVTTDFPAIPDLGFTNMTVAFNVGDRALLVAPAACGSHTVSADLTPNTTGGPVATRTANFTTSYDGIGGACPGSDPFAPTFGGSVSTTEAGGNPDLTLTVTRPDKNQQLRNFNLHLPTGLVANTVDTPRCSQANAATGSCVAANAVGSVTTAIGSGAETYSLNGTIYNVVPNAGEPARLQAVVPVVVGPYDLGVLSLPVATSMRSDYGIDTTTQLPLRWEGIAVRLRSLQLVVDGIADQGTGSTADDQPFMINPSKCQSNTVSADMISPAPTTVSGSFNFTTTGCPKDFAAAPTVTAAVTPSETAKPTGLSLGIQSSASNPTMKRVRTTLPAGMSLNPAAGNGPLQACSAALIDAGGAGCPASSNQGTVSLTTPLLPTVQTGEIFLQTPGATASTRYKLAIVLHLPGEDMILRGSVTVDGSTDIAGGTGSIDSGTGQVVADFDNIPDLGFTDLQLDFDTGDRALLTNPASCGTHTVDAEITPNSGGVDATPSTTFSTSYDGLGGACPGSDPWSPSFTGSVSTTTAGGNPNVTLDVTRADKSQQLRDFNVHLPTGMVANATAVPQCTQVNAAAGNCAVGTQVGTIATSIGSGNESLSISGGTIHNVVPNLNEPARLQAIIPVTVGPFDLGKLTLPVLTSLRPDMGVDAETQIPLRYEGIAVRIRSMQMVLDGVVGGNGFMINPSKCQVNTVSADMVSDSSNTATGSFNFTTNGCPSNFVSSPTITANVSPSETAKPTGLTLGINSAATNPTIGAVEVTLPAGMEINPAVGNGPLQACSAASIDAGAGACPATSNVGSVSLTTPLLTGGQSGNIYLETPGGTAATRYKLAIVVHLPGQDLIVRGTAEVDGASDIVGGTGSSDTGNGRVTTTFPVVPDLAFTNMTIAFNTGDRALLTNPKACGSHTVNATISPNSGGVDATPSTSFSTSYDGLGAVCPGTDPFAPTFAGSVSTTASGGNPDLTLTVTRAAKSQQLRDFNLHLPTGFVANTVATPRCSQVNAAAGNCLAANAVGSVTTAIGDGNESLSLSGTIYNVVPNASEPARLQAVIPVVVGPYDLGKLSIPVNTAMRNDYGIDTTTQLPLRYEGIGVNIRSLQLVINGTVGGQPFMINPTKCQVNTLSADMISPAPTTVTGSFNFTTTGCPNEFDTAPIVTASVSPSETAKPTGLTLGIQSSASNPTLQRVQTTLPAGMEINPAVANGPLQTCSAALIDAGGAGCPATSDMGDVSLTTPLLPTVQTGDIYLETGGSTAADRYKLAIVIHLPGKDLVLHGAASVDGSTTHGGGAGSVDTGTGRVTADFDGIPDLGFTDLEIDFNTGDRALLTNPESCGSHTVDATITPNGGGADATPSGSFTTSYDGLGAACPGSDPWAPSFTGSVSTTTAGGNPNVTLNVTRADKSEQLRDFNVHLPAGMVANATAVPQCTQVNAAAGNCAVGTQVGTINTTIGSGNETLSISGGAIHNVVPNLNEPARLQAIIPVVVGPFDLGKLTLPVLTSLRPDMGVDAETQIPLRYEGIAVRIRSMQMVLNGIVGGNGFMINPSKCQVNTVSADMVSDSSNTATGSFNFTTNGCPSNFGANPTITANVSPSETQRPTGLTIGINSVATNPTIGGVQLTLPAGMEINPAVGNGPLQACSAAAIDAGGSGCPASSDLGTVSLVTPLLTGGQSGNIYLETPGGTAATRYKLAIVVHLPGQDLVVRGAAQVNGSSDIVGGTGSVDSGTGRVTADFQNIPDLSFTNMTIAFNTGNRALLLNPASCGTHTVNSTISPNSGGVDATPSTTFSTSYDGLGGACPGSDPYAPSFSGSVSTTASGGNPDLTLNVTHAAKSEHLRNFNLHLPTGLVANTVATPRCAQIDAAAGNCIAANAVGSISTAIGSGAETLSLNGTIYNVVPNASEPARLQAVIPVVVGPFDLGKLSIPVPTSLRNDYGVDTTTQIPNRYEGIAVRIRSLQMVIDGVVGGEPFMINPTECQSNTLTADMVSASSTMVTGSFNFTTTGCPKAWVTQPTITASVTPSETAKPSGLSLGIQSSASNPTLERVRTTLPVGMEINPAVANGLTTCSTALIDAGGAGCPASSEQGTVSLTTPLLPTVQTGYVYLEDPGATAATRYKLAIVIHLPGKDLILHGGATVDGSSDHGGGVGSVDTGTGQVVADFDGIPDLGFTDLQINFDTGDRALLTNPKACGTHTVDAAITPHGGGSDATPSTTFSTSYDGLGAACPGSDPYVPTFSGSVSTTAAGGNPDLTLNVARPDKHDRLSEFNMHLPAGMVANATAVPQCSQANAAAGNCAVGTQVGTISTSIGTGGESLSINGGGIYNVVPNANEPARLQAIIPVVVGPYDLGKLSIPVLTSLRPDMGVDTTTTLPSRYEGIAVNIRSMQLVLSGVVGGNGFMINPSKCQSNTVTADMVGAAAGTVSGSFNYTTTGCPSNFVSSPTVSATVNPSETAKPTGLTLGINSAANNPTIGRIQMTFPIGMELNPAAGNGLAACPSADITAGGTACPGASVLGTVNLTTPLLTGVQTGSIFLETPGNTAATRYKLAIIINLPGQKLVVRGATTVNGSSDIAGGTGASDTGNGRVTADFQNIPDLAFTNMTLAFNVGDRALFTTPQTCGSHAISSTITPNSGGADATPSTNFTTSYDGAGASCPGTDPFAPTFSGSVSTTASGGHPDLNLVIARPDKNRPLRSFAMHLPVGFVADTVATARCPQVDANAGNCLPGTVVGSITTEVGSGNETLSLSGTINNTVPNASEPARLQAIIPVVVGPFDLGKLSIPINTALRTDLGVDTATTIPMRYEGVPVRVRNMDITINGTVGGNGFMVNPSRCKLHTVGADMLSTSGAPVTGSFDYVTTGCPSTFLPTIGAAVSDSETGQPSGLSLDINVPNGSSTLRRVVMTMPAGMEINPAVGNNNGGLAACDTADLDAGGAACPAGSDVGDVTLSTPLLPDLQNGKIFLETPGATPADRYKLAIVVTLPGQYLVIHGTATVDGSGSGADSGTGRVIATFDNLPDLRFNNMHIQFDTGDDGLLTNPLACGTHTVSASLAPWSDNNEALPPDYAVTRNATFTTSYDGLGGACPGTEPFAPTFSAAVSDATAGANPDVTLTVGRSDKNQQLRNFNLHLPTGMVADTTSTPRCTQVDAGNGACAANTIVGTFSADVGSGPDTYSLSTGTIHNVEPSVGEPARLSARLPVVVGPYDLGVINIPVTMALRADLGVDASTQLPLRWEGVPVRIRTLQMVLNGTVGGNPFMINPSKCQVNTISADMISPSATSVTGTDNFTTTGCPVAFGTAPTITAAVSPSETAKPAGLTIGVNSTFGNPTINRVQMTMPAGMEINPAVGNGLATCSAALIDAGGSGCPAASEQGTVQLTTPLLSGTQTGKVYLETGGSTAADRYKLGIVIDLPGSRVVLHGAVTVDGSSDIVGGTGSTDSGSGQVTADFQNVPDLAFTNMTIAFDTGDRALLTNPDACGAHTVNSTITPNGGGADATPSANFTTSYDGAGAACPGTDPFAPTFSASVSDTTAAASPDLTLDVGRSDKNQQLRNFNLHLPTGLVANTTAVTQCTQAVATAGNCAAGTQVGTITTEIGTGAETLSIGGTIHNVEPNAGEPARLQAIVPVVVGPYDLGKLSIPVSTSLRADMGVDADTQLPLRYEGIAVRVRSLQMVLNGVVGGNDFMVNPSKCQVNTISADMISPTPTTVTGTSNFTTTGCPMDFASAPTISAAVSTTETAKPTGLTLGIASAAGNPTIERIEMQLPAGMEINPAVGNGLATCPTVDIDAGGAGCPAASDQGNVTLTTPLLGSAVSGDVFLEDPGVTPATRYKLGIVLHLPGRDLVLHGAVSVSGSGAGADSGNGQVTAVFDNIPDLGFTNMTIAFSSGNRALLTNPETCGSHTVNSTISPSSGGVDATPSASFTTDYDGAGASCPGTTPYGPNFGGSVSDTQAAGNPDLSLTVTRTDKHQQIRNLDIHLPVGFVANAQAVPQCSQAAATAGTCAAGSQVGTITTAVGSGAETYTLVGALHNVVPNATEPARLVAIIPVVVGPYDMGVLSIPVTTSLRSDLGVDVSAQIPLRYEGIPVRVRSMQMDIDGVVGGQGFLINPSKCQFNMVDADVRAAGGTVATGSFGFSTTNCAALAFNPAITADVTPTETVKPTGLDIGITVPSNNSTLEDVQITLPLGMEINPAVGNGLAACPQATVDAGGAACPVGSQMGTITLDTPLLAGQQSGEVFLVEPGATPSTRYKLAMIVHLPGRDLILNGVANVDGEGQGADSGTGQIVTTFNDVPDIAFSSMQVHFNTGNRALLTNPEACGTHTVSAELNPSSGNGAVTRTDDFSVSYDGAGGACPGSESFTPTFSGSVSTTQAGGNPDLTLQVTRADKTRALTSFDMHLPTGLVADTVSTPRCSQLDAAAANCAVNTAVGSISTAVGSGPETYTLGGTINNVVPDANEPARLAAIIPVVVGPFDLGDLSIPITASLRTADLGIDTQTTIPTRYEGVPVRIRDMQIQLDGTVGGNGFMINPSRCTNHTVSADMGSTSGPDVTGSFNFTTTGCPASFNPSITASVNDTETGQPAGLSLDIAIPSGHSSLKGVAVILPEGMEINPAVANANGGLAACTATDIDNGGAACPAGSVMGTVALDTPLLAGTQSGTIYLETPGTAPDGSDRYKLGIVIHLPGTDLVMHGMAMVDGSGAGADNGTGQVAALFEDVPDVQFTNMSIDFSTGDDALLTNPESCGVHTVDATLAPWSDDDELLPPDYAVSRSDDFSVSYDGVGGACPGTIPQNPSLTASLSDYQAGANADVTLTMSRPDKDKGIRQATIKLPQGLVGSAAATDVLCTQVDADAGNCGADTRVGDVTIDVGSGPDTFSLPGTIHNTVAPADRPAKLTVLTPVVVGPFDLGKVIVPVDVNLDPNDYSLEATTGDIPQRFEGIPVRIRQLEMVMLGIADQGTVTTADDKPFMSNPRTCAATAPSVIADIASPAPITTVTRSAQLPQPITGCGSLALNNSVDVSNTPTDSQQPTIFSVQVNQSAAPTQATLKTMQMAMPDFRLNAPAADGLSACTAAQLDAEACPASSEVGTAWIDTQLLALDSPGGHSLEGKVYLETPGTAADGSDRYKLAVQLTGKTLITIRGIAAVNETTGAMTTTFDGLPDIPFTAFHLELTGKSNPLLINPETCGTSAITSTMTPHAGSAVVEGDTVNVTNCAAKPFNPTVGVNLSTMVSGAHPEAEFTIDRPDGNQDLKSVTMSLPAGFVGSAAAVPMCPIANAQAGTCAAASKIGDVLVKIGSGSSTLSLPGDAYLTAGQSGDIAGMAVKVAAVAGPYDLGNYITLGRIILRQSDHGIDVTFNDIPKMFKGVPTQLQQMRITLDGEASSGKPFLYNASTCDAMAINTALGSFDAGSANVSTPYQATNCPPRAFNPAMSFTATGGDETSSPEWNIKMNLNDGDSTMKSTKVTLPSIVTANALGIGELCENAQIAAWSCPAGSKTGEVSVTTPLLPYKVTGDVFVARGQSSALPDMLIQVGAPINLQIRGRNRFVNSIQIESTFEGLPDMIWTELNMKIYGGPKGLLTTREDGVCGPAIGDFGSNSGQSVSGAAVPVNGLFACEGGRKVCDAPSVSISTKGVKKKRNKKSKTKLSVSVPSSCPGIKSISVLYPKGSKVQSKLMKYKKKNRKLKKNLKNVTGKAGSKRLVVTDFKAAGRNGLKIKKALPAGTNSISIASQNSAVLLPYKTFCGGITGKKKTKRAKLKKCQKKLVSFTFVITREDGSVLRYVHKVKAGDRKFK